VEIATTEGQVPEAELRDLYQRIDYVLIPATVEGGPMSLLEGLAMGKPILAPENVGMIPEFTGTEHLRRYRAGDAESLVTLVTACYEEKLQRTRLVQDRTWDSWAQAHHHLFMQLLRAHSVAVPTPALGFRFGMLGELEIPLNVEVRPLEGAVDQAARHLFHGRRRLAQSVLEEVLPRYPFVWQLLETIPQDKITQPSGRRQP
jgi:hypothetical protein